MDTLVSYINLTDCCLKCFSLYAFFFKVSIALVVLHFAPDRSPMSNEIDPDPGQMQGWIRIPGQMKGWIRIPCLSWLVMVWL